MPTTRRRGERQPSSGRSRSFAEFLLRRRLACSGLVDLHLLTSGLRLTTGLGEVTTIRSCWSIGSRIAHGMNRARRTDKRVPHRRIWPALPCRNLGMSGNSLFWDRVKADPITHESFG